jgi:hypothetical protein
MDYLEKIFLWIGHFNGTQDDFNEYFKLDYSDSPDKKTCGFCADINKKWYDEDFIGYILFEEFKSLEEILDEVPISRDDIPKVKDAYEKLNINKLNAVFWYSGEINPSFEKKYNQLYYVGKYDLD